MDDLNVLYGPNPTVTVFKGTAGEQIYDALLKYQDLPNAEICVQTKEVISYRQMLDTSCRLAQALQRCGFSQNSVLAMYSENCLEYLYPIIAAWYLGIVVAPINHEYIKHELDHTIGLSRPEVVFCSTRTLRKVQKVQKKVDYIKKVIVLDLKKEIEGVQSLNSFIHCNSDRIFKIEQFKPVQFDSNEQVALILCSSGTTGLPKGVMVTCKNLLYLFANIREADFMPLGKPTSSILSYAPRFHSAGLVFSIKALLMGQCSILIKNFEPNIFLQCIQKYRIKDVFLFPPLAVFLARSPICNQYDLSSIKYLHCGGAPLSREIEKDLLNRFGQNVHIGQAYGLTETTREIMFTPKCKAKIGSCGKLLPYMAVKVVDIEKRKSLEANKPGEIWIKGPTVAKGYISNDAATAEAFISNGWLRSGDIGYYDDEGYFYIIDRLKDVIKYKGFQVAPAELEAILLKHPKVSDAGVVGIPDERNGELPTAFVCRKEGQQLTEIDITKFVSDQVSPQKQLRGGVYFVDKIPKNPSGKILRRELRKLVEYKLSKL